MKKESIIIKNTDDIPEAARRLLEITGTDGIIAFYGEMGAGKTTIIREICTRLGVVDAVNSPTFAIVNEYDSLSAKKIYHFDFYRLDKIEEAFDFGCEEYFYSGELCLIEWPEKIEAILPEGIRKVFITVDPDDGTRVVSVG